MVGCKGLKKICRFINLMGELHSFESKGIYSKEVDLDYELIRQGEFDEFGRVIKFQCMSDHRYSFDIHSHDFGEDNYYWQSTASLKETAKFEGHISNLYPRFGSLRGKINVPDGMEFLIYISKNKREIMRGEEKHNILMKLASDFIYIGLVDL